MRILHISAEVPDPIGPRKTRAIVNLLEITPELEHIVYSLNRTRWPSPVQFRDFGPGWRALSYGAPPLGVFLARCLAPVAEAILEDIARRGIAPDLVHAHKLTIDGIVGGRVADALGVPLVLSCQGNTDLKILRVKRDLGPLYRRLWHEAAVVFPFAPWTEAGIAARLGARSGPTICLPCPTPADAILDPAETGPVLRAAFNLATHKVKNARRLIRAAGRAGRAVEGLRLEIAGDGAPADRARLERWIAASAPGVVRLTGPIAHDRIQPFFNAAAGVAMPSLRESYGMVFAEALLAGAPILHSKGFGFDGYLPDGEVSLRVSADSEAEIAEGLIRLARERRQMKARLAGIQASGELERFRRAGIARAYRQGIEAVAVSRP